MPFTGRNLKSHYVICHIFFPSALGKHYHPEAGMFVCVWTEDGVEQSCNEATLSTKHKWEVSVCSCKPLSLGWCLLMQHALAYPDWQKRPQKHLSEMQLAQKSLPPLLRGRKTQNFILNARCPMQIHWYSQWDILRHLFRSSTGRRHPLLMSLLPK